MNCFANERAFSIHLSQLYFSNESPLQQTEFQNVIPTFLATAKNTFDSARHLSEIRVMLDSGSTSNFIRKELITTNTVKARRVSDDIQLELTTMHKSSIITTQQYLIQLITPKNQIIEIIAYALPQITAIDAVNWIPPRNLVHLLNETYPRPTVVVDLLLGVTDAFRIIPHILKTSPELVLLHTPWGAVPAGRLYVNTAKQEVQYSYISHTQRLSEICERAWREVELPFDLESDSLTKDEVFAMQKIKTLLKYDSHEKRFTVGILFRTQPYLKNNYYTALARLDSMLSKLSTKHKQMYLDVINQYIADDIIEKVEDDQFNVSDRTDVYYLPHRAVIREHKETSKLRPVFDASCSTRTGKSLNDYIMAGPPLQSNLIGILVKFRFYANVASADIRSMFTQIKMQEEDRDFLRFLWKDPTSKTKSQSPTIYRFKRLIFGLVDAPFSSQSALKEIAKITLQRHDLDQWEKQACDVILNSFYVDDVIFGHNDVTALQKIATALIRILQKASFDLRKWASNNPKFLDVIPNEHRAAATEVALQTQNMFVEGGQNQVPALSQLGYSWTPICDNINFNMYEHLPSLNKDTKTCVARLLAMIFDPLGFVSPFILTARNILKQTFVLEMKWKDPLPHSLKIEWHKWVDDVSNLKTISIPRFIPNNNNNYTIHVLSDASNSGLGIAAYARAFEKGKWRTTFIMGKSKVAPKKASTIPRLELNAAVQAAKMASFLQQQLQLPTEKIFTYTDSIVVLYWVTKNPNDLIPYVANRVTIIQQYGYKLSYIATNENSSDHASRGLTVSQLKSTNWFTGPSFFAIDEKNWPDRTVNFKTINQNEGLKKHAAITMNALAIRLKDGPYHSDLAPPPSEYCNLAAYNDSYYKLIQQTGRLFAIHRRWQMNAKNKLLQFEQTTRQIEPTHFPYPTLEDMDRAKFYWISVTQHSRYPEEIASLQEKNEVHKKSSIYKLNPCLSNKYGYDIIYIQGRVYKELKPVKLILLPKKSAYTTLLIQFIHKVYAHAGVDYIHFFIRQEYWLLQSRRTITTEYRKCVPCQKVNSKPFYQILAPLISARTEISEPYEHTALDHTGYLWCKSSSSSETLVKHYICVYVCLVSHSITIELVEDHSTDQFLMSLLRLAAQHGMPRHLYSDNHQTYKSSEPIISHILDKAKRQTETDSRFTSQNFQWTYSTPMASNTGGYHEAAVKAVKHPLTKILTKTPLTYVELYTLLKQLEQTINQRPIHSASKDTLEVLTPNMLTHGRRLRSTPKFDPDAIPNNKPDLREKWRQRVSLQTQLWNAWSKMYLQQIQQSGKWFTKNPNIKVGDLVLVESHPVKKYLWPTAKIISLKAGRDGYYRSATLWLGADAKTGKPKQTIVRSIRSLYPLPATLQRTDSLEPL